MHKLHEYNAYYDQKVVAIVQASNDAVYGKTSQIAFDGAHLQLSDGKQLTGKLTVSGFGVNSVFQGDVLQVEGKLRPGYGSYQASLSFAKLSLVKHQPSPIADIRRKFAAGMQSTLPEPLASFAMGLLIGQRATLPDEVKQDLLMVGLTHIIAVSGYNLTIILQASRKLLAKRSKRVATGLSVLLIGVFLLLAGSSASIVRAAIVSMLSIVSGYYGYSVKPLNLLLIAACSTVYANPFYLWSDISWYLSFLAFYGVMLLAPLLSQNWPKRWHESVIVGVALESISAEIMSLPIILHIFGQMSFVGLLGNILVTTLVPLAMLLGLIAGLAGMFIGQLAGWLSWPAILLLTYMLDTAHLLANLPHIFVQNLALSTQQMIGLYLLIILFTLALWFKSKSKSAIITDEIDTS